MVPAKDTQISKCSEPLVNGSGSITAIRNYSPAAGTGEILSGVLVGGGEVADDGGVTGADIARSAIEMPRAPGGVRLEGDL
jgi:hypothetical protein